MPICLAFSAPPGCAAEIDGGKSRIARPGDHHRFAAASAGKAGMAFFGASPAS
jgi:hypothetical protein